MCVKIEIYFLLILCMSTNIVIFIAAIEISICDLGKGGSLKAFSLTYISDGNNSLENWCWYELI